VRGLRFQDGAALDFTALADAIKNMAEAIKDIRTSNDDVAGPELALLPSPLQRAE
jgi:hypothetical protein